MDEKLVDLETRYSYQEDLLQKLNETVIAQQKQLDEQSRQLKYLHDQLLELRESASSAEPGPADEKPPHY
ncbi:MAG: SlyX family protein [Gammaproteobacteria bacterium]